MDKGVKPLAGTGGECVTQVFLIKSFYFFFIWIVNETLCTLVL